MNGKSERCSNVSITIIFDNNPYQSGLETAWGFSCLVKGTDKTILFDTGGDGDLLLQNMEVLGIDPKDSALIFLSHVHSDHIGGFWSVIEKNHRVSVCIPGSFPENFKREAAELGIKLIEVLRPIQLSTGIFSAGELGSEIKEQSLVALTEGGPIVITGCAHPGIVTIVNRVRDIIKEDIFLLMGGFHLDGMTIYELKDIVAGLKKAGVRNIGPCHCSGEAARELFKKEYETCFIDIGVGRTILTKDMR